MVINHRNDLKLNYYLLSNERNWNGVSFLLMSEFQQKVIFMVIIKPTAEKVKEL